LTRQLLRCEMGNSPQSLRGREFQGFALDQPLAATCRTNSLTIGAA
jgi:hypothetical protein